MAKFKELYTFELEVEKEVVKKTTRKKRGSDEIITVEKTVKEKVPVNVLIKKPNRRELEEADMQYSIVMSECVRKGILTKQMLAKKYSDTGGLLTEEDAQELVDMYKRMGELQQKMIKAETIDSKKKGTKAKLNKLNEEFAEVKRKIIDLETNYQSLFDNTADVKAQGKTIQWYILNLTYIQEENDDEPKPFFGNGDYEAKIEKYYEYEDNEDELYGEVIQKVSPIITLWFFQGISDKEEMAETLEKIENEDF